MARAQQPAHTPIGLNLALYRQVGEPCVRRRAGPGRRIGPAPGSRSIPLKTQPVRNQRELAEAVGIREATLTHHLNSMDEEGLITRRRDPANRRVHLVELTKAGEAAFQRMRGAATAFDQRLRSGLSGDDVAQLEALLGRLAANVT